MVFGIEHKVKSHRTGRRRKKGGQQRLVAPWIVITLVCVLVASGLTWGFVALLRSGCSGEVYRVAVAAAPGVAGALGDAAQAWELEQPELDGQCIGVEVTEVSAADASSGISSGWDTMRLGPRPIAWAPDAQAWVSLVSSGEATAGYVSSEPLALGEAESVLAVAESTATELGWLGGEPPSWEDVVAAAAAGSVSLAAANPRSSTEGLVALLNASSDGAGGFSQGAADAYAAAIEAGSSAADGDALRAAYAEAGDASQVMTLLDYQVEDFNEGSDAVDPLVPVVPSGAAVSAVASYVVLGGAGWVSASDARIAEMFGSYVADAVASGAFADPDLAPVEDAAAALGQTTPESVGAAVRAWQQGAQDLNVLFLLDWSSAVMEETVEYGGETVEAGIAAVRMAVDMVGEMEPTWRAGLWEYGVGAGGESNWRSVVASAEMSEEGKSALTEGLYDLSEEAVYEGPSPLYDALVAAYGEVQANAVEGAANVVVVLTNSGEDTASVPTVDETAAALQGLGGGVAVYTVGFGSANAENLGLLAEAGGGSFLPAPADGGILGEIAPA
ncbi:VWA domain-containing protein [Glycomyces terrestris]|uniref:VWA domain-containing protein n=1 Tax=Glycomyces terrestris TaxID=2493553 RepID=A0A426UVT6_9ACTN|nr:VWA domain-containing protein [Glycomyces terrestris]RRR98373.1 VWA domain-containing protein [Glycomyces terrestris]